MSGFLSFAVPRALWPLLLDPFPCIGFTREAASDFGTRMVAFAPDEQLRKAFNEIPAVCSVCKRRVGGLG